MTSLLSFSLPLLDEMHKNPPWNSKITVQNKVARFLMNFVKRTHIFPIIFLCMVSGRNSVSHSNKNQKYYGDSWLYQIH